jgi:hypothetical protein
VGDFILVRYLYEQRPDARYVPAVSVQLPGKAEAIVITDPEGRTYRDLNRALEMHFWLLTRPADRGAVPYWPLPRQSVSKSFGTPLHLFLQISEEVPVMVTGTWSTRHQGRGVAPFDCSPNNLSLEALLAVLNFHHTSVVC